MPLFQALTQPIAGRLTDKLGECFSLAFGNFVIGLTTTLFAYIQNPYVASSFLIASSLGASFHNVGFNLLTGKVTKPEGRASVFGILDSIWSLASVPSPYPGAVIWTLSPHYPFYAAAVLSLAVFFTFFLYVPKSHEKG
ncbi:MAG: MFS transporter [Candidatus Bathycorpusculaceae bacterium]